MQAGTSARHEGVAPGHARGGGQKGMERNQTWERSCFRIESGRVSGGNRVQLYRREEPGRRCGEDAPADREHVPRIHPTAAPLPVILRVITFGAEQVYVGPSGREGIVFGGEAAMPNATVSR